MNKVVCPGCSCLCDDLEITVPPKDGSSSQPESMISQPAIDTQSCPLATSWYQSAHQDLNVPLPDQELENRLATATQLLRDSKSPLVSGLNHLSTHAQSAAWKLADRASCIIDVGFSDSMRAATFAFQQHGKVTATLGEIANRSDLIVYWFCDPMTSHPRLHERIFRAKRRGDKRVIVFHHHETMTANEADEFHLLSKKDAPLVLQTLRGIVSGANLDLDSISKSSGISKSQLTEWAELLTSGDYGSVFIGEQACTGEGTGSESQFNSPVEHWFRLVREINNKTRFVLSTLQPPGNALSATNMLTSLTGFPFAVSLLRDEPEFNWLEHSTSNVLNKRQCDLLIYFGSTQELLAEAKEHLNEKGRKHFRSISKIVIGPTQSDQPILEETIIIPSSRPGWSSGGDFVRHDDVALPLATIVESKLPRQFDVLEQLIVRLEG